MTSKKPLRIVPRALGKTDAARYLGISPSTLIKLSDAGEIPCHEVAHRRTYFVEDLEQFLANSKRWNVRHKEIPREPREPKGA